MKFNSNPYYYPEECGLELVGSLEDPNADWDFHILAVWVEPVSGRLFWQGDSGCSCPTPFEDYRSDSDLVEVRNGGDWFALANAIRGHCGANGSPEFVAAKHRLTIKAMDHFAKVGR